MFAEPGCIRAAGGVAQVVVVFEFAQQGFEVRAVFAVGRLEWGVAA